MFLRERWNCGKHHLKAFKFWLPADHHRLQWWTLWIWTTRILQTSTVPPVISQRRSPHIEVSIISSKRKQTKNGICLENGLAVAHINWTKPNAFHIGCPSVCHSWSYPQVFSNYKQFQFSSRVLVILVTWAVWGNTASECWPPLLGICFLGIN